MGEVGSIRGEALCLPEHRGATGELSLVRVLLIMHKELRKDANSLQSGERVVTTPGDKSSIPCVQEEY